MGAKPEKTTQMIAIFSDDFQLETTFEWIGIGTRKIEHTKEQYLLYNW